MNSWRGNINKIPPSGNWFTRQNSMISELDGETDTCLKQISNPMIILFKITKKGYLISNSFGKPKFSNEKTPYLNGWYLLMKYRDEKKPDWLKNHINKINKYTDGYYTKIFDNKICIGKSKRLELPQTYKSW